MNRRILLLEDDLTSQQFLSDVLSSLPVIVDTVQTVSAANNLSQSTTYDLFVFDQNLGDGTGSALITRLRKAKNTTPALCLSADIDNGIEQNLLHAGFDIVLAKPLSADTLIKAANSLLAAASPGWNDESGLRAVGGALSSLNKLRSLFVAELPNQLAEIIDAQKANNLKAAKEVLHKIKAASGFVGANQLRLIAERMSKDPSNTAALNELEAAVKTLLQDYRDNDT